MQSPHFFVGLQLRLLGFKNWDSDSKTGLKLDTDSWNGVIVTVYWVNDANKQILKI